MAKEAITLHLEGILDDNGELPEPTQEIEPLRNNPDYVDAVWAAVQIHLDWRRTSSTSAA